MANPVGKAILTVLGVFGSMVGGFLPNEFPDKSIDMLSSQQAAQNSMVRVVIVLNGVEGLTEADGTLPAVVEPYQPSLPLTKTESTLAPQTGVIEDSGRLSLEDTWISGSRSKRAPVDRLHICKLWAMMIVSASPISLKSGQMVHREGC